MKKASIAFAVAAALLAVSPVVPAQNEGQAQGTAIVTVLPKQKNAPAPDVSRQSVRVEVNGKSSEITSWHALRGTDATVELVVLIDNSLRESLGRELDDITHFVQSAPPNVKIALAYMENGRAAMAGPLTADHAKTAQEVHLPLGAPGISASPYFCLSDLAKNWPSQDRAARREVIMITDGVDPYEMHYDPEDPYVHAAIEDSARAGLVVYSIYWRGAGRMAGSSYENDAGQNLLQEIAEATGGTTYWIGTGNPVSLQPYFEDLTRRLNDQFELGFTAPLSGKAQVESLNIKINAHDAKVTAPRQTFVAPAGAAPQR
ncbi:MAG TPA: hypothetical protein VHX37_16185 [Acidobacteriaceae bacterium]|nr:hypothetical protein [Acidobacteriaceae bacterium]